MPAGERIHSLDAARACAILLVIALHSLLPFMSTDAGWAVHEPSRHLVIDGFVWVVHAFTMPAFFSLSGFFLAGSVRRAGVAALLRQRAIRLLIPLAVFLVPTSMAMNALWDWGKSLSPARAGMAESLPELRASEHIVTLGHLWFLYYLLAVTVIALCIFAVIRRARIPHIRSRPGFLPLLMTLPAALILVWAQKLQLDTALGFALDIPITAYHGLFFLWGWLLSSRQSELESYGRYIAPYIGLAALSFIVLIPVLVESRDSPHGIPPWAYWLSACFTCSMVTVLLGACTRYAAKPNRTIELLSRSSYWTYVLHLPPMVLIQIALYQTHMPAILQFSVAVMLVLSLCLLSYRRLVQHTWLAKIMG